MTDIKPVPVLILAGSRNSSDPVAAERGVSHKAIAPVGGRPMIMYVLDAIKASPWVNDVYISIEDHLLTDHNIKDDGLPPIHHIPPRAKSICGSIKDMVTKGGLKPPFIVVTADHALLTAGILNHFAQAARQQALSGKTDFSVAMVAERAFRRHYPDNKRTFLKFRDDNYSSCNMFAFHNEKALKLLDFWAEIEHQRKKPWRIARMFGLKALLCYGLRIYKLQEAMDVASRIVGIKAAAVTMPYPEAAIDVDTVQDLFMVENILELRANTA